MERDGRDIARRAGQGISPELLAQIEALFHNAPTFAAVVEGPEHVFRLRNASYDKLIGHRHIIGKTARDAFPETVGQGVLEMLDDVFTTGEPFIGKEVAIRFAGDEGDDVHFRNFVYQPLKALDGTVCGIFVHGVDVTSQELASKELENTASRLRDAVMAISDSEARQFEFLTALAVDLSNPESKLRIGIRELRRAALSPEAIASTDLLERQHAQLLRVVKLQLDGIRARRNAHQGSDLTD